MEAAGNLGAQAGQRCARRRSIGRIEELITRAGLFARLSAGSASRTTVITPNRRLSQALVREFDAFQVAKGLNVWDAPDILPFSAFVTRLYEDALYLGDARRPILLTPAQEEQLWRQCVEGAGLLAPNETAARCRDAWNLSHAWRIPPMQGNEDASAFLAWSREYLKKIRDDVDAARLPDLVMAFLTELRLPQAVVPYAFDIVPQQTREFFQALAARGVEVPACAPDGEPAALSRTSFASAREELERAACWARARLESGAKRIGVVVPDLQLRRREVARVFSRVMDPAFGLPGAKPAALPFNVSLGTPLAGYPLVRAALGLLEISQGEVSFDEASVLMRSPFLGGAQREWAARAQLEVRLRRKVAASVNLPKLIAHAERAPQLRGLLEKIFSFREAGLFSAKTPAEWARHFSALLHAAGFPGERALDSVEFQAQAKWHEMLAEFARLDRVSRELPFRAAFGVLRKLCADTLFQPESGDAPVQVLGVLESAAVDFDCLWVSGLTDEAWPLKSSPNPFLPIAAQKRAGIPEASAEGSLALDRRITEGWKRAAPEVVFSFYEKDKDRDVSCSPLVADIAEARVEVPVFSSLRDSIFENRKAETLEDRVAPPVRVRQIHGGTRVLSDQAACPFRAFAKWRLGADELEAPPEGLDAALRGKLLHELMKHLWKALKDSSALERDLSAEITAAADAAVRELQIEGRFADLERERLERLAGEWLAVEKTRPPFSVSAIEDKRTLQFAGLEFSARIDRMDQLSTGGHALIDYKTSRAPSTTHWSPPRPHDMQLPLYALSAKEDVTAVAFAKIAPGDMRFVGFTRDKNVFPKAKQKEWAPLLSAWKAEADSLGKSFGRGDASVDPKKDLMTCRYCGLETLCRVYEKVNIYAEEEGEE